MSNITLDLVAAGGNRHSSAADWAPGLLAFGAGNNLALWDPEDESHKGVSALLTGHTDAINVVKIIDSESSRSILTGSADTTIRVWRRINDAEFGCQSLAAHEASINVIATLPEANLFVSGSADKTVKIWKWNEGTPKLVSSISLKPRFIPLTCALTSLDDGTILLAVAGTSTFIQLYVRRPSENDFELQATLTGHESWIRSLDFHRAVDGDVYLASASQDKYIRLWLLRRNNHGSSGLTNGGTTSSTATQPLSNKSHQIGHGSTIYIVNFEALLIGHEDWIYTAKWAPRSISGSRLTLLSACADNSLAVWQIDEHSGVWVCTARLGDISSQKGSTTATGSTGGFWVGLWQPDGLGVVSLGRTGSWRRWTSDPASNSWQQRIAVSGHTQAVRSAAWAPDGSYLLSTSADQTTRLFAEWRRSEGISWHEFTRPQIHGYDLNCIDTLTPNQFISGADEKLLRVFNKPKAVSDLLSTLCGLGASPSAQLADAANMPVLGLSNKAITAVADDDEGVDSATPLNASTVDDRNAPDPASIMRKSTLQISHPPFEDHLARHTLWPEHEKLYGHGYEISAVAASHDGRVVATACKASSLEHAVIRLYECTNWREVKPALPAHSLTVTKLAFAPGDRFLLSVGRDRQWTVFMRNGEDGVEGQYEKFATNPKGHARMILDCSWGPAAAGDVFATAGRDKAVKVWNLEGGQAVGVAVVSASAAVTAVAFDLVVINGGVVRLAYGTEEGSVRLVCLHVKTWEVESDAEIPKSLLPSAAVNDLQWRPRGGEHAQLAIASEDSSLRIVNIDE